MAPKKNQGQNIVKGAMILSMSIMITKIIGILYRLPVTNALGDVGNGIYSVAYQVYIIIITLTSIGLPSAISKLVSERRAVGDYKAAHGVYKIAMVYSVGLSLVLSIVLWFGAGGASLFFQMPEAKSAIRALVPAVVIVTIMAVMKGYFQGMQSMAPTAIAQIIEQLVHAIVSIVLAYVLLQFGLEAAVVGSTLGVAVGGLVGVGFLALVYYLLRDR
ncbi:MAG: oligosaccharide flippase family protein, partial [Cellulosilyticaceae bacterium]